MQLRELFQQATHRDLLRQKLTEYRSLFTSSSEAGAEGGEPTAGVVGHAREMTAEFYDLVTDFYEFGWGRSFHFAPRHGRETFQASLARHEHYLAMRLGLAPGMRAIDLGCGVGGPLREIARFSGAQVVGLNINAYQIEKGAAYNREEGVEDLCSFLEGSFLEIPAEDESFDAAYGIEATCHAESRRACFAEAYRVLKPGGTFAVYEWCMTDAYRPGDTQHEAIKLGIELGNSLPPMPTQEGIVQAFRDVGFADVESNDLAQTSRVGDRHWYEPLEGRELSWHTVRQSAFGRWFTERSLSALERVKAVPAGSVEVSRLLNDAADQLVAGGRTGIFTPMLFCLGRKPE